MNDSFFGGIASAWRRASPERIFLTGLLLVLSYCVLVAALVVFYGG